MQHEQVMRARDKWRGRGKRTEGKRAKSEEEGEKKEGGGGRRELPPKTLSCSSRALWWIFLSERRLIINHEEVMFDVCYITTAVRRSRKRKLHTRMNPRLEHSWERITEGDLIRKDE